MGLETPTFINDLTVTNPVSSDPKGQGDDHIRNLKTALKNTFPNASKAYSFPDAATKSTNFTILSTEQRRLFLVDTTGGQVTATLPTLVSGDAGWECSFIKTNTGTNAMFIAPPSGTIKSGEVSGLTKTRRCIPGRRTRVVWTGTEFIAERVVSDPIGTVKDLAINSLPVGFEWANGTSLSSAADYPDYNAVRGGLTVPDHRGRVIAGKDDMGGVSANRLTNQTGGLNGDTFEATGGAETHTLTTAQLASHSHGVNITTSDMSNDHTHPIFTSPSTGQYTAGGSNGPLGSGSNTGGASTGHTHNVNGSSDPAGSGSAHNNVQPTIVANRIIVVE